jgi:hypothetical protein
VCSTCLLSKGDVWIKAHLWRLTISLPEMAIDRACGIDPKGRLLGEGRPRTSTPTETDR